MKHRLFHIAMILLLIGGELLAAEPRPSTDVAIARFSAARIRDLITLNWNTLGEANNLGFEIERRSQFETRWQTVAYLRGSGSDGSGKRYSYVEQVEAHTVMFYRLKQIDVFGNALYTPAVTVTPERFDASIRVSSVQRTTAIEYDQVSLALPQAGAVHVRIFDALGRELTRLAERRVLTAGFHVIPFQSADLRPGVYSVRLETENGTLVEMLTKTN